MNEHSYIILVLFGYELGGKERTREKLYTFIINNIKIQFWRYSFQNLTI